MPVFYGTDRDSKPTDKRMNYDFDRAKRLELGRAMVTVPKVHEVPNIERPWVYRIPLTNIVIYQESEDPKRHFTMQEVKALSRDDFLGLVRARLAASSRFKDHALVFIHGFNTTFDFGVYRAAQMSYDLKFDGAPFIYSWPSKGQIGLQDYGYDRGSAEQAEPYLKEFLQLVARESGAKTISIIAHSMGNLLLLPVLREPEERRAAGRSDFADHPGCSGCRPGPVREPRQRDQGIRQRHDAVRRFQRLGARVIQAPCRQRRARWRQSTGRTDSHSRHRHYRRNRYQHRHVRTPPLGLCRENSANRRYPTHPADG